MKLIQLQTPDEELIAQLCLVHGCTLASIEDASNVLEAPDDLDLYAYPNVVPFVAGVDQWAAERAWLLAYKGTFHVYLSVQQQLLKKKKLSEAQWHMVRRGLARAEAEAKEAAKFLTAEKSPLQKWLEAYSGQDTFLCSLRTQYRERHVLSERQWACAEKVFKEQAQVTEFTIKPGTYIVVTKFYAQQIAEAAGCTRPHYGMEVLAVHGETSKAYELTLRLVAMRAGRCCVCGAMLTNPQSIANGIGPICAEGWGVEYDDEALDQLAEKLKTFAEVRLWVPKKAIKERIEPNVKEESSV